MCAAKFKHLTLDNRISIENGLNHSLSFKCIGSDIDKDCTTVSKEVRLNSTSSNFVGFNRKFNPCIHRYDCDKTHICEHCKYKREHSCCTCDHCYSHCDDFAEERCLKLSKPPYVCNGCSNLQKCVLRKRFYYSHKAQEKYTEKKSVSRSGVVISQDDIDYLNNILVPTVKEKHQSIHHVYINHKNEIMFSEKTVYKLIDLGLLKVRNIDLPLKVRRRVRKSKAIHKVDTKCRIGRTYDDYQLFMNEHSDISVVQMDSVIGRKGGKVLLTLHFTNCNLMLAFIRNYNDALSVIEIFNELDSKLGTETFKKLFPVILTDNGSEFSNPTAIELEDENQRTKIFYCNPSAPFEKGSCEVNHEFIRRISPKGKSFDNWTQEDVNKMMSHINSYGRNKLNGKSPIDLFINLYGKETLNTLNITKIDPDEINLSESLIKEVKDNER